MTTGYDIIKRRFHEVQVEKEARLEKIAAKQQEFDALSEQINALEAQKKEIHELHLAEEKGKIFELDNELGTLAKALQGTDRKARLGSREEFLSFDDVNEIKRSVL